MASIKKYKNKKGTFYEAFVYLGNVDGKEIKRHKMGFTTKREANDWIEQVHLITKIKGLPAPTKPKNKKLFESVVEEWLNDYYYQVKPSTYRKTNGLMNTHILPHFSGKNIDAITSKDIQQFVNSLRDTLVNYTPPYNYLRNVFQYAYDMEYILQNPFDHVKKPKKRPDYSKEQKKNVWTKDELIKFLEVCKQDQRPLVYPFFRLLAYSGLRRGEILALTWDDIDFNKSTVSVNKALTTDEIGCVIIGSPKNQTSIRTIKIDPETMDTLKQWHEVNQQNLVFPNQYGKFINFARMTKILRELESIAKVTPISLHGLRHTHCTLLIESGANIKTVQHRLGHSDIETTLNIYTHVNKQIENATLDNFMNYLKN